MCALLTNCLWQLVCQSRLSDLTRIFRRSGSDTPPQNRQWWLLSGKNLFQNIGREHWPRGRSLVSSDLTRCFLHSGLRRARLARPKGSRRAPRVWLTSCSSEAVKGRKRFGWLILHFASLREGCHAKLKRPRWNEGRTIQDHRQKRRRA
jgi:hypothetical protein